MSLTSNLIPKVCTEVNWKTENVTYSYEELMDTLLHLFEVPCYLLAYLYDRVEVALVKNHQLIRFDEHEEFRVDDIIELRLFYQDGELYLLNEGERFFGRIIKDEPVGPSEQDTERACYDIRYAVWGSPVNENGAWTVLSEKERGFYIPLPVEKITKTYEKVFYIVRNYLKYDPDGIIAVEDARLCGFVNKAGLKLKEVETVG